ncbi:MAG: phosphate ABC transporter permease [Thermoplasmata archaeon]|nr:MAG: phosphate ABC transporter permease [Thermoplasmata archaeon]
MPFLIESFSFFYSSKRKYFKEIFIKGTLFVSAIFAIVVIFFIIFFLFKEGHPIFENIGLWNFLSGKEWNPTGDPPSYGAFSLILGTLLVTSGAMIISVPLGFGSAIFISEIAPPKIRSIIKSGVEILAGIPSVVYGFFGLTVLTDWLRVTFDKPSGECWLAGSILLGIMALPTIISVSEDAISSVPMEYKEASLSLGATKWQTISKVIVPSALSGITAAIILGIGRAIGETMAVMMVTGNAAIIPKPITNVFSPIRTITGTLGIEMGEVAYGSTHYHALFGLALILFAIVLIVNMIANVILGKLKEKHMPALKKKKRKMLSQKTMWRVKRSIYALCSLTLMWLLVVQFGIEISVLIISIILCCYLISKKISAKTSQRVAFGIVALSTIIVLFILGIILYYIIANGARALSWEFLSQYPLDSGRAGGIYPAIIGTLYLVGGAILIALPIGIGAAIYLTEYTKEGLLTKIIRTGIEALNGTPSIVFGLFGFAFLVLYLNLGVSLLAGQITLALMILPTIIRTTEESLKSVPQSMREASLALGATKWQTVRKVVLPPAMPGIITGTILSIGRAAGETAPIMFTAVVFSQRFLPTSPLEPVMALPYHLFVLTTSVPGAEQNAYGTALVLLLLVICLYIIAIMIRNHYRKMRKW